MKTPLIYDGFDIWCFLKQIHAALLFLVIILNMFFESQETFSGYILQYQYYMTSILK